MMFLNELVEKVMLLAFFMALYLCWDLSFAYEHPLLFLLE